jgi:heme-degrading monooxygenase HmoA
MTETQAPPSNAGAGAGAPAGPARVIIYFRSEGGDTAALEEGYRRMAREQATRRGLVSSELLRSVGDSDSFAVLTEWETLGHFIGWQRERGHDDDTSPMDAFLDRRLAGGKYAEAFAVVG